MRVNKTKAQAGYYQTGDNERRDDITINGNQVRMGPNSTITPAQPQEQSAYQNFLDIMQGRTGNQGENFGGVRGAIPGQPGKGADVLAAPMPAWANNMQNRRGRPMGYRRGY